MERYAHIVGWGLAVPERVLTNADLARMVDTNDEWIYTRTGIRERRIAGPKETTVSLSTQAARAALDSANIDPETVDLIIVATSTPNHIMPATACLVQDALGAVNAGGFDLSAACTGFIYALNMGAAAIQSGAHNTVVVIGAETMSRIVNWNDRGTCILFGDGAGAVVLRASEHPGGVLCTVTRADGSGGDSLVVPAGGSAAPASFETVRDHKHTIHMDGKAVYRFATRVVVAVIREAVQKAGLTLDDIALFVPHQANRRIIESAGQTLGVPEDRLFMNIDRMGNTSAASIPIALAEAAQQGRLRPNDHVVVVGFGSGLTWGASVIKWDATPPPPLTRSQQLQRQAAYQWARVRSLGRRLQRQIEGRLFGSQSPESGAKPPKKSGG